MIEEIDEDYFYIFKGEVFDVVIKELNNKICVKCKKCVFIECGELSGGFNWEEVKVG